MNNIARAAEVLADWADSEGGLSAIDRDYDGDLTGGAEALADATPPLLMPDPHIIRTVEELEALDDDAFLMASDGNIYYAIGAKGRLLPSDIPAVVIREGAEVRAARKALEEA